MSMKVDPPSAERRHWYFGRVKPMSWAVKVALAAARAVTLVGERNRAGVGGGPLRTGLQTFEKKLHSAPPPPPPPLPTMVRRPRAVTPARAIRRSQVQTKRQSCDMADLPVNIKAAQDAGRKPCAERRGDEVADVE